MLQRPYTLDTFQGSDISVPTWASDCDGLVVIEQHTADNRHLESRLDINPESSRPIGFVVFNEMTPLTIVPTLAEAIQYATGYWDGAYDNT